MLTLTLLWITLSTGLRTQPNTELQKILDRRSWLAVTISGNGCNSSKLVVAHSYKLLGKKIGKLNVGDTLVYDWCKYKAVNYRIVDGKKFDKRTLDTPGTGTLRLYTCVEQAGYVMLIEMKPIGRAIRIK